MNPTEIRVTEATRVLVVDEPGSGNACHAYRVEAFHPEGKGKCFAKINFQKGPIQEEGVNGLQIEDLLAIVIHRLDGFQNGAFSSPFNARALDGCRSALVALEQRTASRRVRGVEGMYVR